MKTLNSLIKSIGFLLLFIFVLQVGGLTCANDIYATGLSGSQGAYAVKAADLERESDISATGHAGAQGSYIAKAVDFERGTDTSSSGDLLSECQCPCHLNFSHIEPATVTSFRRTESQVSHMTELSIRSFSREILQPPKILI